MQKRPAFYLALAFIAYLVVLLVLSIVLEKQPPPEYQRLLLPLDITFKINGGTVPCSTPEDCMTLECKLFENQDVQWVALTPAQKCNIPDIKPKYGIFTIYSLAGLALCIVVAFTSF